MKKTLLFLTALSLFIFKAGAQDTDAPQLNYIDLAPSTVANGDSVEVIVSVTDASQISSISVSIVNPDGGQAFYVSSGLSNWESLGNDTYSRKGKIPQYAMSGIWYIYYLSVRDEFGNEMYTNHNDSTLGEVYVNSNSYDDETPQLISVRCSEDTVNNGDSITFILNATDNLSGIKNANLTFKNNEDGQSRTLYGSLVYVEEGDQWDTLAPDQYSIKTQLTKYALEGDWHITRLTLEDLAENYINYSTPYLDTFYVKSSSPDVDPPVLLSVDITTDTVNTGEMLTIEVKAVDSVAGIKRLGGRLRSPDESETIYLNNSLADDFTMYPGEDGNEASGWVLTGLNTYSQQVRMPEDAMEGEWFVQEVEVRDSANIELESTSADSTLATVFVKYVASDHDDPIFDSLEFSADTVDNSESISMIVYARDTTSGLKSIEVTIRHETEDINFNISQAIESWTDLGNGGYSTEITVGEYDAAGYWYASSIVLIDQKDNELNLRTTGGSPGLGAYYVKGSTADITPPSLNSVTVTPSEVLQGDSITVRVNVTDDMSGTDSIMVAFIENSIDLTVEEPGLNEVIVVYDWTKDGDWYTLKMKLSDTIVLGNYSAKVIFLEDIAGNSEILLPSGNNMGPFKIVDELSPDTCDVVKQTIDTTICQGESYLAEGALQTSSGTYYDTLKTVGGCDSIVTTNITVQECASSISEEAESTRVQIYPNPSQGVLYCKGIDVVSYEIFDFLGREMEIQVLNSAIDISNLPEGMYILRITNQKGKVFIEQIVLEK